MIVPGYKSQNSAQPRKNVTRPRKKMKTAANATGSMIMMISMTKAMNRRANTPWNSSGLADGS
jgi:hypothetical protein